MIRKYNIIADFWIILHHHYNPRIRFEVPNIVLPTKKCVQELFERIVAKYFTKNVVWQFIDRPGHYCKENKGQFKLFCRYRSIMR